MPRMNSKCAERTQRLVVYRLICSIPPVSKFLTTLRLPFISNQSIANLSRDGPMTKYVEKAGIYSTWPLKSDAVG